MESILWLWTKAHCMYYRQYLLEWAHSKGGVIVFADYLEKSHSYFNEQLGNHNPFTVRRVERWFSKHQILWAYGIKKIVHWEMRLQRKRVLKLSTGVCFAQSSCLTGMLGFIVFKFTVFYLLLVILGNSYKFQAGSRMNAMLWFKHLSAACQSNKQQVSSPPPPQTL